MSRWTDYVHVDGDAVVEMWAQGGQHRRSVFLLGEGFDPRMLIAIRKALDKSAFSNVSVISLGLAAPGGTSERAKQAEANTQVLSDLLREAGIEHQRIPYPALVERRTLSRHLLAAVLKNPLFTKAEQVVLDISALPVGVYFGLIKGFLDFCHDGSRKIQLQVCVAENVEIDRRIAGEGVEAPTPILGFSYETELDPQAIRPLLVWAPILGEGAAPQMEALAERLVPDEVCPVLPFPARNPRHADDLMIELRRLLVEELEVEPSNYIYADERNPFDLYRALTRLQDRYRSALRPAGEASVILSLHSSKSLSLGALLAAYEHRLPALNAEPDHYGFSVGGSSESLLEQSRLSGVWLVGEPTE